VSIDDNDNLTTLGKKAQGYLCFVSIHHNSFNGKVQGVETLIERTTSNAKDRELATEIQSYISKFDYKDRGVKEQGLAVLKGADSAGAVSCLVECYFIDSLDISRDEFILKSKDSGDAISVGIKNWADKKGIKFDPPTAIPLPVPTTTQSNYPYVPATLPLIISLWDWLHVSWY